MRSSFIAATLSLALAISPVAFKAQAESSGQSSAETYQQLTLFGDVLERVRAEYVTELTDKELIEAAINGMLTSLDPHSGYLNEANFRDMRVKTRGEFGGLGIEVTMENGFVKVVSPIDDTPAANAGIEPGDFITHLDDEPVLGLTLSEAVEKMRGRIGTTIVLTVRREGEAEAIEIPIKRDVIRIRSVRSEIQGDIGIIRVSTFSEQTSDGVEDAIASFKDELGDKLTGVVLDLRNNPGGLLDQAISVSDIFLDNSGDVPIVQFLQPGTSDSPAAYFSDPAQSYYWFLIDNQVRNEGDLWSMRADVDYDIADGGMSFLKTLRFGARWADRTRVTRNTNFSNWGNLSAPWTGGGAVYADDYPASQLRNPFVDFQRGKVPTPAGDGSAIFFGGDDLFQLADRYVAELRG